MREPGGEAEPPGKVGDAMHEVGEGSGAYRASRAPGDAIRVALDAHMVGERETGNETYILNLIRGLTQLGGGTQYLLYSPRPAALDVCGPLPPNVATRRVWPGPSPLRIPLGLPARVLRDRADVLHVTYVAPPAVPAAVVATVHDISYTRFPEAFSPRDRWMLGALVPRTLRRAEVVITVSEHARREIISYYGTPEEKIVAIYQSVAPGFRPVAPEVVAAARARYGLAESYVLAVGNLQPRKNLARLIGAYASLRRRGVYDGRLVLVGKDKWQGSQVSDVVRRLGLERDVSLTGYVPMADLAALYGGADLFVYPSLYEGFGLPPLEAMACGCPVVASNSSSLPEVVGDAGLVVDPLDEAELATALERALRDAELRRDLVARGYARSARFSSAAFASATRDAYERAARIRRSRARGRLIPSAPPHSTAATRASTAPVERGL